MAHPADDEPAPSLLVVTNMVTHYRLPLFKRLSELTPTEFLLFSDGGERYWGGRQLPAIKTLDARILRGVWLGRTRITPGLPRAVMRSSRDVVVKDINGKLALPMTYVAARLRRRPFVLWTGIWSHPRRGLNRWSSSIVRYFYRHADAILTYGRHVSEFVASEGADPTYIFVAPQAVDMAPLERLPPRDGAVFRVLYLGRLEPEKGADVALDAVLRLRDRASVILTVVGSGSLERVLRTRAAAAGASHVLEMRGTVAPQDVRAEYARADAVVVPSVGSDEFAEPWSLVVNEAMAAGRPIVGTSAVGATRDGLLEDGRTGLVTPPGDAAALAAALERLLREPELREALVNAAAERVAAYTFDAAARAFVTAAMLARARHAERRTKV